MAVGTVDILTAWLAMGYLRLKRRVIFRLGRRVGGRSRADENLFSRRLNGFLIACTPCLIRGTRNRLRREHTDEGYFLFLGRMSSRRGWVSRRIVARAGVGRGAIGDGRRWSPGNGMRAQSPPNSGGWGMSKVK